MDIVIGIIFISLIGTLLHFMYEWSGHNKVVSLFAAVNESTWEHICRCSQLLLLGCHLCLLHL